MNFVWSALTAFVITALAIIVLRPLAVSLDLIDRPGGRKTHHGDVPITGGIAMFIGTVVGLGLLVEQPGIPVGSLSAAFGLLVLVGMFDDRFNLSPWTRLPIHAAVALLLVQTGGARIITLGDAFGYGSIGFSGVWIYVVTVVLMAAAVNAFNMLDGMDGIAGTTAAVALSALGLVAWQSHDYASLGFCTVLLGSVIGFLLYNIPISNKRRLRCFMGDAGSTLLGIAVAWSMVRLTQPTAERLGTIDPVTALWIGGLPVIELVWSFMRRLLRGRSPFVADAEHFHHLLMRAGFSVRGAFAILLLVALALAMTGLVLDAARVPERWSLLALLVAAVFLIRLMNDASRLLRFLPKQARRSQLR